MAEPPEPLNIDDSYKTDEKSSPPSISSRLTILESTLQASTSDYQHLECRQQITPRHLIEADYESTSNSSASMLSNDEAEITEEEELMDLMDSADTSDIRSFRSTQQHLSRQIIEFDYERGQVLKYYEKRMNFMESTSRFIVKREDLLENKQPSKSDIMAEPPKPLNIDEESDSSDEKSFLRSLMRMLTCLKTPQVSTSDTRHLESLLKKVIVLDDERQPSKSNTVAEPPESLNLDDSTKSEEESSLQHSIKMPTSLETPQASTSDFSAFERFLPQITQIIQHMESLKKQSSKPDIMAEPPEPLNIDDSYKTDEKSSPPSIPSRLTILESALQASTSDYQHLECRPQTTPRHLIEADYESTSNSSASMVSNDQAEITEEEELMDLMDSADISDIRSFRSTQQHLSRQIIEFDYERGQVLKDYEERMNFMESTSPFIVKREDLLENKQPSKSDIMAEPPKPLNIDEESDSSDEESFLRSLMRMLTCLKTPQVSTSDTRHLESLLKKVIVLDDERQPSKSNTVAESPESLNLDDSTKSEEESSFQHSIKIPKLSLETLQASTSDFSAFERFQLQIILIIQHMESLKKYVSELDHKRITLIIRYMKSLKKCVAELDHERSDSMEKQLEALNGDDFLKSDQELSFIKGLDTQTQRQADRNLSSSCSDHSDLSWNYTVENKELEKIKDSKEHIYKTTSSQFTETNKGVARVISTKQELIPTSKTLSNTREDNLDFTNESDKTLRDYQETKEMNRQNRQKIDKTSLFKAADNQVKNDYTEVKESMMDSTAYNYDSTSNSSDPMLSNDQAKTTEELMDSADITDIQSFRSTQLSRQINSESDYQRGQSLKDYERRISVMESSSPIIVKREDLLENKQPFKVGIMAEPPKPLNDSPKFDENSNSSYRPKCFMIWRQLLECPFPGPRHCTCFKQNIWSIESDYKRSADDQVKNIQVEKSTEDSTIYNRDSTAISSASMPLDVQTKATEEEEFMDPTVSAEYVPNTLSNDTSLDIVFGTHWWATVIAKLKNFQNTRRKNFWKCFSKALCMFTIKCIYYIVSLILILLLILPLFLSLSLFLLYFRLDIYQNYKSTNTITFPTAAVEIEKGISGQDQIVQVLTEYLQRDSRPLKVVALIGNISDESYMVDLRNRKFSRRTDSDFSIFPNFIVFENLRAEHLTDFLIYVKSFQKAFGNLQITILADFKVEQISNASMRSIYLNRIINTVKDAFIQANISIKIIPCELLNKNASENTL